VRGKEPVQADVLFVARKRESHRVPSGTLNPSYFAETQQLPISVAVVRDTPRSLLTHPFLCAHAEDAA